MPFSQDTLDYIASLNAEEDVAMLRRELPLLREVRAVPLAFRRTLSTPALAPAAGVHCP